MFSRIIFPNGSKIPVFHIVFFSLLDALVVVPVAELVLFVTDEVVGVDDGFTEGEAWDPGEDEAAMAAFFACCTLAAMFPRE